MDHLERTAELRDAIARDSPPDINAVLTRLGALCKVRLMASAHVLQPTLWRTCRVLANRTRLQMLGLLLQHPDQTVSAVADQLKLSLPAASQNLRALEARGLLTVRRVSRRVKYRIGTGPSGEATRELIGALRRAFRRGPAPVETLFNLATAFTQPRRIEIFRALQQEPQSRRQLKALTGMSSRALARHLRKLEARGFVLCRGRRYSADTRPEGFGRALASLAASRPAQ